MKAEKKESQADVLTTMVENRLDALFHENGLAETETNEINRESYPLRLLKTMILSIDWEITEVSIDRLLNQINSMKTDYENDPNITTLLRIEEALGKHLQLRKADAHPNTLNVLKSTYHALEQVIRSKISDDGRKTLVRRCIDEFKALKKDCTATNLKAKLTGSKDAPSAHPPTDASPPVAKVLEAIDDIKQLIENEFAALKAELNIGEK